MSDLSEDVLGLKQEDFGGDKVKGSSNPTAADRLTNEEIAKDKLGRKMAVALAGGMGMLAVLCIGLALYTGYHFLDKLDDATRQAEVERAAIAIVREAAALQAVQGGASIKIESLTAPSTPSPVVGPKDVDKLQLLAPLIPATFSSALGLIILVTLARFISNFVLTDKKNPPKDQDYGAISVLVKEIGSVVNTLRGKNDK